MKNRNPRTIMLIFLLVVVIGGGVWYFMSRQSAAAAGVLTASGTVETTRPRGNSDSRVSTVTTKPLDSRMMRALSASPLLENTSASPG